MPRGTTRLDGGVSRRSFLKLSVVLGGGAAAIAASAPETAHAAENEVAYPEKLTFAVMSDVHLFSPELWSDCPDYTTAENSDRKMFRESSDILDKAIADVVAIKPDMVLVPGDLTKDGERVCHEWVRDRFAAARQQLAAVGVGAQFYVINGNHDLNNHHGKDFSGGTSTDAERTDPLTYKSLWAECGYTDTVAYDADGTADGSLSYVAHPCPGLTLIAVDTCKYNVVADDGTLAQETSGHVPADLLAWVCDQAREARAAGDVVVAFQHHGIVPHFGYEPVIFGEYLVDDYETVAKAYAEAGISAVFTGHMHANDIAAATYGENTIYDIETGSLVTYPSRMRMGSLEFAQKGEKLECTLTVDSHDLGDVTLDECGLATTAGITAYGKERTLTVDSVTTMLNGYIVDPLVAQLDVAGSIKPVLAGLLGCTPDTLGVTVFGLLTPLFGTSFEDGLQITPISGTNLSVFYNADQNRIEAWRYDEAPEGVAAIALSIPESTVHAFTEEMEARGIVPSDEYALAYITPESLAAWLDALCESLDEKALFGSGRATLLGRIEFLVTALLTAPLAAADSGKDYASHQLLELVDFAYQSHLMGNEAQAGQAWATNAIADTEAILNETVSNSVDALLASDEFVALAKSIPLNIGTLLAPSELSGSSLIIMMVGAVVKDLSSLLGYLDGATIAGLLMDLSLFNGEPLTATAHNALDTLVNDTNVTEDHDFSLEATATLPSDPDDDPDQDVVDKSGLQAVIDQAEGLELAGASQAALDRYYGALAAALRLMSDPNATEAQVAEAQSELATAIEVVKESRTESGEGGTGSNTGNGGSAGSSGKGGSAGSGALPKTGDSTNALAAAVATVLGGAAIAAGVGVRAMRGSEE